MNAAKPITAAEYQQFFAELYKEGKSAYSVDLAADPSVDPRKLNGQIERVQAYKNRVLPILNRAVANEAYWKSAVRKLETRVDMAEHQAMVTDAVRAEKNAESRKASAKIEAGKSVLAKVSAESGRAATGEFIELLIGAEERHADALSFLIEVKNIYENLDSTDMNLARQQRNILICAKLYSEAGQIHDDANQPNQLAVAPGM